MKILVGIWHPAHVHTFKNLINELKEKGHDIKVVAIHKEMALELLDIYQIDYDVIGSSGSKDLFGISKGLNYLKITSEIWRKSKKFNPDLLVGRASSMMAHVGNLLQIPYISYFDTDIKTKTDFLNRFLDIVFTPSRFKKPLKNVDHIEIPTFKELAYLHPQNFEPDESIFSKLDVEPKEKISLVRFVAWDAWHDVGYEGFTKKQKIKLINNLDKYSKVYISSEDPLPNEIREYQLDIPKHKIHDMMYFSDLYIGESPTMAAESAILGTPSIYVSSSRRGFTEELEKEYDLVLNFNDPNNYEELINKSKRLIKQNSTISKWNEKRKKLLKDKINLNSFLMWLIENYPESLDILRDNKKECLKKFKLGDDFSIGGTKKNESF